MKLENFHYANGNRHARAQRDKSDGITIYTENKFQSNLNKFIPHCHGHSHIFHHLHQEQINVRNRKTVHDCTHINFIFIISSNLFFIKLKQNFVQQLRREIRTRKKNTRLCTFLIKLFIACIFRLVLNSKQK